MIVSDRTRQKNNVKERRFFGKIFTQFPIFVSQSDRELSGNDFGDKHFTFGLCAVLIRISSASGSY